MLDFAVVNDLVISTATPFQKRISHLVTCQSGGTSTHFEYTLTRRHHFKHVINTKFVPATQATHM